MEVRIRRVVTDENIRLMFIAFFFPSFVFHGEKIKREKKRKLFIFKNAERDPRVKI